MSTTPQEPTEEVQAKPTSAAAWKKAGVHNILLPSGVRIELKILDLPALIEAGEIPQHLLETALGIVREDSNVEKGYDAEKIKDLVKQQREFTDHVTRLSVVTPMITYEQAHDLPFEDREMIVAIATRQRDLDAEGAHIAGLDKSERFRRFRKLAEFEPTVEGY